MRTELVVVNLGTPSAPTPEAVRAFLGEFLSDPLVVDWPRWLWKPILRGIVLRRRPARVARLYEGIWTERGSPLAAATEDLAAALAERAPAGARVTHAYRYGEPGLAAVLRAALDRAERVVVVPLFPQRTASSAGTVETLAERLARSLGAEGRLRVHAVPPREPGYVAALARRLEEASEALPAEPERLVVSFHSIPARVDRAESGRYSGDCAATAAALAEAAGFDPRRVLLTYQSRFGPEPWLGPQTQDTLVALAREGVRRVAVSTPGFLTPGLETLEEIDERARAAFLAAGGEHMALAAAPAGRPELLDALLAALPEPKSGR